MVGTGARARGGAAADRIDVGRLAHRGIFADALQAARERSLADGHALDDACYARDGAVAQPVLSADHRLVAALASGMGPGRRRDLVQPALREAVDRLASRLLATRAEAAACAARTTIAPAETPLRTMHRIRALERIAAVAAMHDWSKPRAIHPGIEQDARAAGILHALRRDDWLPSTHPGRGHALAGSPAPRRRCAS